MKKVLLLMLMAIGMMASAQAQMTMSFYSDSDTLSFFEGDVVRSIITSIILEQEDVEEVTILEDEIILQNDEGIYFLVMEDGKIAISFNLIEWYGHYQSPELGKLIYDLLNTEAYKMIQLYLYPDDVDWTNPMSLSTVIMGFFYLKNMWWFK